MSLAGVLVWGLDIRRQDSILISSDCLISVVILFPSGPGMLPSQTPLPPCVKQYLPPPGSPAADYHLLLSASVMPDHTHPHARRLHVQAWHPGSTCRLHVQLFTGHEPVNDAWIQSPVQPYPAQFHTSLHTQGQARWINLWILLKFTDLIQHWWGEPNCCWADWKMPPILHRLHGGAYCCEAQPIHLGRLGRSLAVAAPCVK